MAACAQSPTWRGVWGMAGVALRADGGCRADSGPVLEAASSAKSSPAIASPLSSSDTTRGLAAPPPSLLASSLPEGVPMQCDVSSSALALTAGPGRLRERDIDAEPLPGKVYGGMTLTSSPKTCLGTR